MWERKRKTNNTATTLYSIVNTTGRYWSTASDSNGHSLGFHPNTSKQHLRKVLGLVAPVSQRSWVRFPFKPGFFQVSSFQPLRLENLHCDDLHIILSLSAVQIYEFHILMFIYPPCTG